ncbi:RluA family pseudouridine synthase [Porticoccus sp. W117]|uniref:RluA family pseudouridine synthase n=1 Tax=Porticoccus sp. W117 TaxID=3054777 RepID=UPI0025977F81|nr:RluA family pseudouridine synthase [Porticoccus sp. W117]MDM3871578.1 RluA family pseudouridine synthase [Porticoccus sp. W117]
MSQFHYQPPQNPLDIVHVDDHLIVLNKPCGLLTVPGRLPEHRDSLALRVQQQYSGALVVHRLDMDTSGIVVMALNQQSHRHLSRQFQDRHTQKAYYAWVWGEVAEHRGSVDLPLICDWPNRPLQKVDHENGKPSLTHWQRLAVRQVCTLLELQPHTGRSHQLRVHMQAIGHPILGDRFYAHTQALEAADQLQLHAARLALDHPVSGELMTFEVPPPFELG